MVGSRDGGEVDFSRLGIRGGRSVEEAENHYL